MKKNTYLVEASRKPGLFEPYESRKYYLMSQDRLSKMLLQPVLWAIWSAKRINLELTPLEQLQAVYGTIENID